MSSIIKFNDLWKAVHDIDSRINDLNIGFHDTPRIKLKTVDEIIAHLVDKYNYDTEDGMKAEDFVINAQTISLALLQDDFAYESMVEGELSHQAAIDDGNFEDHDLTQFIEDSMTTPRQAAWAHQMLTLSMKKRRTVDALSYVAPADLMNVLAPDNL